MTPTRRPTASSGRTMRGRQPPAAATATNSVIFGVEMKSPGAAMQKRWLIAILREVDVAKRSANLPQQPFAPHALEMPCWGAVWFELDPRAVASRVAEALVRHAVLQPCRRSADVVRAHRAIESAGKCGHVSDVAHLPPNHVAQPRDLQLRHMPREEEQLSRSPTANGRMQDRPAVCELHGWRNHGARPWAQALAVRTTAAYSPLSARPPWARAGDACVWVSTAAARLDRARASCPRVTSCRTGTF
eukprot:7107378-Prymnesium_polylepis.1